MSITPTPAIETNRKKAESLLSLDAGGPRGISQLQILKILMDMLSRDVEGTFMEQIKRPCEIFAAIGGTGTGGLIAILLVVLEMTAEEALDEFTKLVIKVFKNVSHDPKKQTEKLNQAIHDILISRGADESTKLMPPNGAPSMCKLIVPIMYKNQAGSVCVLKNYLDSQGPPTNLTIAEAMLATCATPPLFSSTVVSKDFSTFEYMGADIGLSNPIREIIVAAHCVFGDDVVVPCLLSIGCGHPGVNPAPSDSDKSSRIAFLEQLARDSERVAQEINRQMGKLTLYHRLSVNYGLENSHYGAWKDPDFVIAHTLAYLDDLEVVDAMNHCIDTLRRKIGFTTLEQLIHSGGGKILPPEMLQLTPNYVERRLPMKFIETVVFAESGHINSGSKRVIVTGIGGCGKTQLVRKFIETHGDRFQSVFFIDGTSEATIAQDIVRHVRSLGGVHSQKSFDEAMRFLSQSVKEEERLLVIDNVDDPKLNLSKFLPRWNRGTVFITSRNVSHGQLGISSHLELDMMSLGESLELLSHCTGRTNRLSDSDQKAAEAVAEELGFLPIALVQAASYMFTTGCSAEAYISRLRTSRERVLSDPATSQVDMRYKTAFAAFDASYDILPSNAQKTLHLVSFFNRQQFPVSLINLAAQSEFSIELACYLDRGDEFKRGIQSLEEIFYSSGRWDPVELDSIIASLRNHSLISIVSVGDMILSYMHPLLHEWARLRLVGEDARRFQDAAVRLLCCGSRDENYLMMRYLYSHVQALSSVWPELHVNDAASFGSILQRSGFHSDALKLRKQSQMTVEAHLGGDHLQTVRTSARLARAYYELGRYIEAERLEIEVLRQRKRILGDDHRDTLAISESLASTYGQLGRFAEAERLGVEVLQHNVRTLGPDHTDTVRTSLSLAATYFRLGRYADAARLQAKVLEQRKRTVGDDHPDTAAAASSLATSYHMMGRFAESVPLLEEVLKQRTRMLGVDHLDTVDALGRLASTYSGLGRREEAERMRVEVLTQRTKLLGVDHPDTIWAVRSLSITHQTMGRYREAVELLQMVVERRTTLLGDHHPDTLSAMLALAYIYRDLHRHSEAIELAQKTSDLARASLGDNYYLTQQTARFLTSMIDADEALNPPRKTNQFSDYMKRTLS